MCTFEFFVQIQHGIELALLLVFLGTIALALERFAKALARAGASHDTVRMLRFTAKCLFAIDLAAVLALAIGNALGVILCLL